MNAALNLYEACAGYKRSTGHTVEWTRSNPDAWEMASGVMMAMRNERKKANG